jgi:hypothetical protein
MAIGSVPKSSPLPINIEKDSYHDNSAEVSTKDGKDPKAGDQTFGPSGVTEYGTGDSKYNKETAVTHKTATQTYDNAAGTGAYGGEVATLEVRARYNDTGDVFGKKGLGIEGQAQANLFRGDVGVDYKTQVLKYGGQDMLWADAHANGGALVGAQVDGSVNLNLSLSSKAGFNGRVGAFAGALVRGEAEARGYLGGASIGVHARGQAMAGAEAWAEATVGLKGIHASAGAFAGASAGGAVGADVMGIGVEAGGSVWAGAGAKAGIDVTWKDGKLKIGADAGAALGVGGEGEVNVTIDTDRLIAEGKAVYDTGVAIAGQAEKDAASAWDATASFFEDAAKAIGDAVTQGAKNAGGTGNPGTADAGDVVKQAVDTAEQAASDVWNWLTGNG